ncbi:ThiF family adenylyltransferase [Microbacterium aurantiacum]|uniref:ThiF family adenylyltransferase n=1 Tax=Microbacterium aurantiacum TaxID=162393 RepID=UPI001FE5319E|nr:ThiF family adenylyltransferase [Microbacterium aurantiacum]
MNPAAPLEEDARSRYARQLALPGIGDAGQRRLAAARVLVIGAGGLGTPVLAALAAAGVGVVGVVDDDAVEVSNLHRQLLHGTADLGRRKTTSARDALHRINPEVEVHEHRVRLTATNADELLTGYDLVVDGSDNFDTRYLVADAAERLGMPCVWGAVLGYEGQVTVFWPPYGPGYRDLHPDTPGDAATCATGGVLGMVCHAIGAVMAAEVIKIITGAGRTLLGRLLMFDALDATWRTFALSPDPDRPAAGATEADASPAVPVVLPSELARELARDPGPVVIDVREPAEVAGSLSGALRIPLGSLASSPVLDALAATTPVVTVCASGVRAARAGALLAERGFRDVRSLAGAVGAVADATAHMADRA